MKTQMINRPMALQTILSTNGMNRFMIARQCVGHERMRHRHARTMPLNTARHTPQVKINGSDATRVRVCGKPKITHGDCEYKCSIATCENANLHIDSTLQKKKNVLARNKKNDPYFQCLNRTAHWHWQW